MRTISVHATTNYNVYVGNGILCQAGKMLREVSRAKTVVIISDSNVWPLYGKLVYDSMISEGYLAFHYIFPAGEKSKNSQTYLSILNFLAENRITRSDCIIALGGGVVGDMTGFIAATYMRRIDYIQIPTTLLAAVDSSVGGKTAIDLPSGKNLVGAFYQPLLVLCDTDTFNTLPEDVFLDGCAEVIKYGILYDQELFDHLAAYTTDFHRESTVTRCVELKRDVVALDEFDEGLRQKLNLGHTVGHGIEAASQYQISHGKAVAAGMAIIARASCKAGLCHAETTQKIEEILAAFSLPTGTTYSLQEILESALSDKKRAGNTLNLIVPCRIGECNIHPVAIEELESFISEGL